jgi:tRNA (adenine37-N6)-methyltransferase
VIAARPRGTILRQTLLGPRARLAIVDLQLRPIGVVRSPYATPLDAPRQGEFAQVESIVELAPAYEAGLEGVEAGGELLVVWWAHLADRSLLARPGTDGVFAMRTPHRPNPICLSEVRVVRREGARLVVTGLEATDGTPVLDLNAARAEYDGWTTLPAQIPE